MKLRTNSVPSFNCTKTEFCLKVTQMKKFSIVMQQNDAFFFKKHNSRYLKEKQETIIAAKKRDSNGPDFSYERWAKQSK